MTGDANISGPAGRRCESRPHVLREYALLADGQRGALVGPHGEIAWMCAPDWHSDAVFSTLIGGRGSYMIRPVGRYVWGGYYEPGSLIWRSRWVTESGIIECREALAFPGEPDRAVLLRRLVAVAGEAWAEVLVEPAGGFGRHRMSDPHRDSRDHWRARVGPLSMRLQGAPHAAIVDVADHSGGLRTMLHVPEGGHHDLVLELSTAELPDQPPDAAHCWTHTETAWSEAVPELSASIAPADARHAYAVLRGLTGPDGGMVAAATMSLPERAEQGRNYDYRYVWIRDQCYAGQAVAADGPHPLLDDATRFVTQRLLEDGPELKPAYTIHGGPVPDEKSLSLPGYPGGTDIVGNHVNAQSQLDAFGEALLLLAAAARHQRLDRDGRAAVHTAVAAIARRYTAPDAGIWELDNHHWAHSRLICVAGLRAAATSLDPRSHAPETATWHRLADKLLTDTSRTCVHRDGRWQRAPEDPRIDGALLLPALRGALPAAEPRSTATLAAVRAELARDHYVYRFRHDARPLGHAEGAFTLCGFVTAMACHQQGDPLTAARYFERNRAACGPPGLFCEEYDITQRQLRGNLPQAFVHALMLEASVYLNKPAAPAEYPT